MTALSSQRAAAIYLRELLLKPGRYRDEWQKYVARPREGVINQMAVAEVIASRIRSAPEHPGDARIMPHQLRDVVSGALSGHQLGDQILGLFIAAFEFADHENRRLRELLAGSQRINVLSGSHAVPAEAEQDVDQALGLRRHLSVSLHDHVYVGADGRIERARTMQVIEAQAAGLDRIPFLCDTNVLTIEAGQGCQGLADEVRQIAPGVFATEIMLAKTLDAGETATLDYWITYRFPGDLSDPAECEYRRAVMLQLENLDMRVQFHPALLPAQVWWSYWDGVDGELLKSETVTLDSQNSTQRYMRSLDRAVVGFRWSWD